MFGIKALAVTMRLQVGMVLLAGAFLAEGAAGQTAPPPVCTPDHCRVPPERRTTQDTRPLEFRGSTPMLAQRDILSRYDDTFGCLVPEARDQAELDLLAVDWGVLLGETAEDPVRFCLLGLLSTLDDAALVEGWARGAGFERLERHVPDVPAGRAGRQTALVLWGFWDAAEWHRHVPSRLHDLFGISTVRAAVLTVEFDAEGRVIEAVVGANSTFN